MSRVSGDMPLSSEPMMPIEDSRSIILTPPAIALARLPPHAHSHADSLPRFSARLAGVSVYTFCRPARFSVEPNATAAGLDYLPAEELARQLRIAHVRADRGTLVDRCGPGREKAGASDVAGPPPGIGGSDGAPSRMVLRRN